MSVSTYDAGGSSLAPSWASTNSAVPRTPAGPAPQARPLLQPGGHTGPRAGGSPQHGPEPRGAPAALTATRGLNDETLLPHPLRFLYLDFCYWNFPGQK